MNIADIAKNDELLEIGRREKDGSESSIIRFGPETALRIGLSAIANHIGGSNEPG